MTRKYRSHQKPKQDPDIREVKLILLAVGLVMVFLMGTATLGQQAQPLRFLDGIVQYADAVEFYIPPDQLVQARQVGTGTVCPTITGPASADSASPPVITDGFYMADSSDTDGCFYPVYLWDEGSILPREFDQYILTADTIYSSMDWGTVAWNGADSSGAIGCNFYSVANEDDPRINVTGTYEAINLNDTKIINLPSTCDQDTVEFQRIRSQDTVLANDFVNRINDTYYAIGGKMGPFNGQRDTVDRRVPLELSDISLNFVFQLPADYTNNWWQLQEHPMYINNIGTPTGDQFSDNDPPIIDSGFFGIDDITFTMDTGLDDVERGQVVLFKQFNKANLLGGGWDVSSSVLSQSFDETGTGGFTPEGIFIKPDGLKLYSVDTGNDQIIEYDLSTAWDITSATLLQTEDVSTETTSPEGVFFKPDGLKMFILAGDDEHILTYKLSTAWDISTSTYDATMEGDTSSQEAAMNGFTFRSDGTKMYVTGILNDRVYEYDLTTAWDPSTITFLQDFNTVTGGLNPESVRFSPDGLQMFTLTLSPTDVVNKFNLTSAWDISTALFNSEFEVESEGPLSTGLFFKTNGLVMFVQTNGQDSVFEYDLTSTSDSILPEIRVKGGIQSVGSLGDTKIHIEVRDHPLQAGQTQFFSEDITGNQEDPIHDGQDYFNKNRPIKFLNNGSLGVIEIEPTLLGTVESFDISLSPFWDNSISDIVTVIVSLQDNSTTGSLIANITSIEIEDVIRYDFADINELLFFEDDCSSGRMSVTDSLLQIGNDENCGADMSNGLVNINAVALEGVSGELSTPDPVTNLTVEVITDDTLILKWDHNQGNTTGYRIDRDDGSGLVTYIKNTAVSSQSNITTTYGSGSTFRFGIGGSIDTTFTDINYNVTNYPSRANAFGLEDNTFYEYRICALNGDLVGTCSATVGQTTPDSEPFWQLFENSDGTAGVGGTRSFSHDGGDGDWLSTRSGLIEQGGRDGGLMKSFNIAEYGLEDLGVAVWYIDWVGTSQSNHISRIMFCDGDLNRFSTNPDGIFQIRKDPQFFCIGHTTVASPGLNDGTGFAESRGFSTGANNAFTPILSTSTVNLNSTHFPSGFVTVMIGARDRLNAFDQGFDIKNFTWINSTSWNFESGNGASLNWTAGINQDNENNRGYGYADPEYANCNAGTNFGTGEIDYKFIDNTFDCDLGTVKAVSSPHVVLREVEGVNDWQYREGQKPTLWSYMSVSSNSGSNSEGIVIDSSKSEGICPTTHNHTPCAPAQNAPRTDGRMFLFKEFPSSVLQEGNITMNVKGESGGASNLDGLVIPNLSIYNTTVLSEGDASFDRWNSTQWSRNAAGTSASGVIPNGYCQIVLNNNCIIIGGNIDASGQLIARDGDNQIPFDQIRVTGDLSATNTTDTITVFITQDSLAGRYGTITIENVTVGLKTFNFTNSNVRNEIGENRYERVTRFTTDEYQLYTGTLGNDMGVISPGSIIVAPPNPPTDLTAIADIADVELEWTASGLGASAQDFKIERSGLGPLSIQSLVVNFNFDGPPATTYNNVDSFRWGNDNRTKLGETAKPCNLSPNSCIGDEFPLLPDIIGNGVIQMNSGFTGAGINTGDSARAGSGGDRQIIDGNRTDWDFLSNGDWTWNAWIHPDVSGEKTLYVLSTVDERSTFGSQPNLNGTKILIDGGDANSERFAVQVYDNENHGNFVLNETSPNEMYDDDATFHMYSIIHKNGQFIKWYRDGVLLETDITPLISSRSGTPSIMMAGGFCASSDGCRSISNVTISGTDNGGLRGGTIQTWYDEWSLWDIALDSSDIATLYGSGDGFNFTGQDIPGDDGSGSFETIVPSLLDEPNAVFSEDFSSYPDNATANLIWTPLNCQSGTGGADNFCGVNSTSDTIVTKWSNSGSATISYDLLTNLGITATDSNGDGDFSITWNHLEDQLGATVGINYVMLVQDTVGTRNISQDAVCFRFVGSEAPTDTQVVLSLADNEGCSGLDDIDSNVEDGDNDFGERRYFNVTKSGNDFTADTFNCEEMTVACRISTMSASAGGELYRDLRYVTIAGLGSGSSGTDYKFDFDDFTISLRNGVLLESYRDRDVELATEYNYRVSSLNIDDVTESDPSNIASVLTNNIPDIVQNTQSNFDTPNKIDVQWDSLAFDSGIGQASTGLNLTKYQLFRENVTASGNFELLTELFASSPPPNFFNDTSVSFPDVFNYEVSACNPVGCSSNSSSSTAVTTDPPSPVLDTPVFNATAVDNTVSLDWNDSDFALNYTVLRNSTIIAQGVSTSDYIDPTVLVNTNYNFSAYGVNNNGNGTTGFSNLVLTNDVPTEPLNFIVNMGTVSPFLETPILNWTSPIDQGNGSPTTSVPIINYTVERKQGIGSFSFLKFEMDTLQGGTTDDTAVVGANYTWYTKACNIVGCGPFSNTASLIVTPTTVPNAVENLTATTLSGTEIFLQWDGPLFNVSNQPTEYRIQQRHVGFTGFVTLFDTGNILETNTISSLLAGNTYDFRIAGLSGAGQGPFSNIAQNITFTVPTSPQNLNADTLSLTSIFLDWLDPVTTNGGIIQYDVEIESPIGNGFSSLTSIFGGFTGGDFEDDFSSYPDNATGNAVWIQSTTNCQAGQGGSNNFCGVNATSDKLVTKWSLSGANTISYDLFTNEGFNVTDSNGDGDFSLLWNHLEDDTGAELNANTYYMIISNQIAHSQSVNDGICYRFIGSNSLFIPNIQHSLVLADNEICTGFDDLNLPEPSDDDAGQVRYVNMTKSSDDITVEYYTCKERTVACKIDTLSFSAGGEVYRDLRYITFSSISGSSGVDFRFEFDDIQLFVNGSQAVLGLADSEYTATGLTTKTEYNFRVNATNEIGTGPYSNQASNITFGVPDPPINLSGFSNGISEITVTWDEGLSNYGSAVTGYRIDQAQEVGGTFITAIANTGNNIEPLSETFIGLLQQTQYVYRIAAINGFGLGPFSANLTAGTFIGASSPENFFVIFNATRPYSTFMSWETPLNDGGQPIAGYLIERKDVGGSFQLIANLTSPLLFNYTDTNLLNLAQHEYRVAAYSNPTGTFTAGQPVTTVVPPNFSSFTINEFTVVGDVLNQQYTVVIDDCFPTCTLTQADIERNGIVESNYIVGEPIVLDSLLNFTTFFIIPTSGTQNINTTAIVTNLGVTGDEEVGVVTTSLEFVVDTIFFNHSRNTAFTKLNFELVRHPVPWNAECEIRGGRAAITDQIIPVLPFGGVITLPGTVLLSPTEVTASLSLQGVGSFESNPDEIENPKSFNVLPSRNAYMSCDDPTGNQILAFVSFGTGNGTLALTGFTNQLGTFLGVPVPFIFVIILAAIWTGRSASTGIIFLAVAIGAMGVLGYFDPLSGDPTQGDTPLAYFWLFIVFLTLVGVFLGKRFF